MNDDFENWFESEQYAIENFVGNFIGNRTSEEIDQMKMTPELIEHTKHFVRLNQLRKQLHCGIDTDNVQSEYLKAIANGDNDTSRKLEDEIEYNEKFKDIQFKTVQDLNDRADYDGRDDALISEIAEKIKRNENNKNLDEQNSEQLDDDQIDFSTYLKLV